ncbi:MAG: flagellar export chaperone FlgN [Armatimonadota bacterium]|jgi:hypothetical protein|nr:flagellar export chaperone FlgN [Armatimonadota bacterium]
MVAKTDLAKNLLQCLRDISSLLDKANVQARMEQDALVANDPAALVATCRAQDDILQRIIELDRLAGDITAALLGEGDSGKDPSGEHSAQVWQYLPESYSALVEEEINRINRLAKQLQEQHEINRILIQNGLEIVACCLRTLASDPGPSAYSPAGSVSESTPIVLSLDRKV